MTPLQSAILGLVEGISEYLPISSTGHLVITASLLGLDSPQNKPAVDAFNIVIQGGAILAVLLLYWPRFLSILRGLFRGENAGIRLLVNLIVAFIPAALIGPFLDPYLEAHLFKPAPVIAALAIGGVYMILIEQCRAGCLGSPPYHGALSELDDLTPVQALFIGVMQCFAMIPGTSRSMMTITAGVLTGLRPRAAAEFSFLLGVPTLGAACAFKLLKDILKTGKLIDGVPYRPFWEVLGGANVAIGLIVATVSAALAVRWLVGFLNRHGLTPFGVYRLLLAACLAGLLAGGIVRWS